MTLLTAPCGSGLSIARRFSVGRYCRSRYLRRLPAGRLACRSFLRICHDIYVLTVDSLYSDDYTCPVHINNDYEIFKIRLAAELATISIPSALKSL